MSYRKTYKEETGDERNGAFVDNNLIAYSSVPQTKAARQQVNREWLDKKYTFKDLFKMGEQCLDELHINTLSEVMPPNSNKRPSEAKSPVPRETGTMDSPSLQSQGDTFVSSNSHGFLQSHPNVWSVDPIWFAAPAKLEAPPTSQTHPSSQALAIAEGTKKEQTECLQPHSTPDSPNRSFSNLEITHSQVSATARHQEDPTEPANMNDTQQGNHPTLHEAVPANNHPPDHAPLDKSSTTKIHPGCDWKLAARMAKQAPVMNASTQTFYIRDDLLELMNNVKIADSSEEDIPSTNTKIASCDKPEEKTQSPTSTAADTMARKRRLHTTGNLYQGRGRGNKAVQDWVMKTKTPSPPAMPHIQGTDVAADTQQLEQRNISSKSENNGDGSPTDSQIHLQHVISSNTGGATSTGVESKSALVDVASQSSAKPVSPTMPTVPKEPSRYGLSRWISDRREAKSRMSQVYTATPSGTSAVSPPEELINCGSEPPDHALKASSPEPLVDIELVMNSEPLTQPLVTVMMPKMDETTNDQANTSKPSTKAGNNINQDVTDEAEDKATLENSLKHPRLSLEVRTDVDGKALCPRGTDSSEPILELTNENKLKSHEPPVKKSSTTTNSAMLLEKQTSSASAQLPSFIDLSDISYNPNYRSQPLSQEKVTGDQPVVVENENMSQTSVSGKIGNIDDLCTADTCTEVAGSQDNDLGDLIDISSDSKDNPEADTTSGQALIQHIGNNLDTGNSNRVMDDSSEGVNDVIANMVKGAGMETPKDYEDTTDNFQETLHDPAKMLVPNSPVGNHDAVGGLGVDDDFKANFVYGPLRRSSTLKSLSISSMENIAISDEEKGGKHMI